MSDESSEHDEQREQTFSVTASQLVQLIQDWYFSGLKNREELASASFRAGFDAGWITAKDHFLDVQKGERKELG
jgi:hypothetical protein